MKQNTWFITTCTGSNINDIVRYSDLPLKLAEISQDLPETKVRRVIKKYFSKTPMLQKHPHSKEKYKNISVIILITHL